MLFGQVMAVHSAIVNGRKEVCSVSQKEMLELMEITDEVRTQIGEHTIILLLCSNSTTTQ